MIRPGEKKVRSEREEILLRLERRELGSLTAEFRIRSCSESSSKMQIPGNQ